MLKGHLDAIVLWSVLPLQLRSLVRPVAAKDYWEKGHVRRYLARTFNALLIDRTDIKVHQSPVDLMRRFSDVSATDPSFSREWGDYFPRTATPALRVPDFNMSTVSQAN